MSVFPVKFGVDSQVRGKNVSAREFGIDRARENGCRFDGLRKKDVHLGSEACPRARFFLLLLSSGTL